MPPTTLGLGLDLGSVAVGGGGVPINPDARTFIDRVIADGGTVEDISFLNSFVKNAKANNYWSDIVAAYSPSWGVKGTTTASSLYSITGVATDLLQAAATNRPTISAADLAGKSRLTFDGIDNFMKTPAFTFNQPETVVIGGYQAVTWGNNKDVFDGDTILKMQLRQQTTSPLMDMYAGTFGPAPANVTIGSDFHIRALFNGVSSVFQRDAETANTGNVGASNAGGFTLGATGDGASKFGNIKIGMVVLLSSAVDGSYAAKMTALYNFSKSVYGTP